MSVTDPVAEDVRMLIAETLGLEPEEDEIVPDAHWELDLGGESIDLIDLSFRIEKHFGVPIQFRGVAAADLAIDDQGMLTQETLESLNAQFPFLDLSDWETRPFTRPLDLITVGCIVTLVRNALAAHKTAPAG